MHPDQRAAGSVWSHLAQAGVVDPVVLWLSKMPGLLGWDCTVVGPTVQDHDASEARTDPQDQGFCGFASVQVLLLQKDRREEVRRLLKQQC